MKFKLFSAVITAFLALTTTTAMATPVYNLGLPCGPGTSACNYSYNAANPTNVFTSTWSEGAYGPGLSSYTEWSNKTVLESMYWESAVNDGNGNWWQSLGGLSVDTFVFTTTSDYYSYGCCEPDWWSDVFTRSSSTTVNEFNWMELIASDGTTITHTYSAWGNSTNYWDNYSRQAGGSYSSNSSSWYETINWASGSSGSEPWRFFSEQRYPDPSTATPEPSAFFLSLGGLMLVVGGLRRK